MLQPSYLPKPWTEFKFFLQLLQGKLLVSPVWKYFNENIWIFNKILLVSARKGALEILSEKMDEEAETDQTWLNLKQKIILNLSLFINLYLSSLVGDLSFSEYQIDLKTGGWLGCRSLWRVAWGMGRLILISPLHLILQLHPNLVLHQFSFHLLCCFYAQVHFCPFQEFFEPKETKLIIKDFRQTGEAGLRLGHTWEVCKLSLGISSITVLFFLDIYFYLFLLLIIIIILMQ